MAFLGFFLLVFSCWGETNVVPVPTEGGGELCRVVWLLYGLIAVLACFVVIAFVLVCRIGHRLVSLEKALASVAAADRGALSVEAITQSKLFSERVQQLVHVNIERSLGSAKMEHSAIPSKTENVIFKQGTPACSETMTETELALLFDLMGSARFRFENSFDDGHSGGARETVCTLFLSEINQQYKQNYTKKDCEALVRKLVLLVQDHPDPLLAAGSFMRIRFIRENVAIDFDTRVIDGLRERFA